MTHSKSPCPPRETWEQFLTGGLEPGTQTEMEQHLESCPTCEDVLREAFGSTHENGSAGPPGQLLATDRFSQQVMHQRGGLGEVWVAHDNDLDRRVALKRIREDIVDGAGSRERFLREARLTGKLEHPGVVPVHAVGFDANGHPYYAMRFIEGESLRDRLRSFHQQSGQDTARDIIAFRKLLSAFVSVCHTVQYAHSRGVTHRDLKPANVMLGPHGETLVVDWGLAKGSGAEDTTESAGGRRDLPDVETMAGQAVGTPAYMSPEQAAVLDHPIGPASDVFGLGVMLYEIVSGRLPEGVMGPLTAPARFPDRGFTPPGPAPPALAAICRTATAADPADRYGSAQEIADDVERWLADLPVSVHQDPWPVRFSRWSRRHRTLVATVVVVLCTSSLALAGLSAVTVQKNRQIARSERIASVNYARSRDAVRDLVLTASDDLFSRPGFQQIQRRLLDRALSYYDAFTAEPVPLGSSQSLRFDRADAHHQSGLIRLRLASMQDAAASFREAVRLWGELPPAYPERDLRLAESQNQLGVTLVSQELIPEAIEVLTESVRQTQARLDTNGDPQTELALARMELNLSRAQWFEDREASLTSNRTAVVRFERLAAASVPTSREYLVRGLNNLAAGFMEMRRLGEAVEMLNATQSELEALVSDEGSNINRRQTLARILGNLAICNTHLENVDAALAASAKSIDEFTALTSDYPADLDLRVGLTKAMAQDASFNTLHGDHDRALRQLDQALALSDSILTIDPKRAEVEFLRFDIQHSRAIALDATGHTAQADLLLRQTADLLRQSVSEATHGLTRRRRLVDVLVTRHELLSGDDPAGALGILVEALEQQRAVAEESPDDAFQQSKLSDTMWVTAAALRAAGRHKDAIELVDERTRRWPTDPLQLYYAAWEMLDNAAAADATSRPSLVTRAFELLEQAHQQGFNDVAQLRANASFQSVQTDDRFQTILQRMTAQ